MLIDPPFRLITIKNLAKLIILLFEQSETSIIANNITELFNMVTPSFRITYYNFKELLFNSWSNFFDFKWHSSISNVCWANLQKIEIAKVLIIYESETHLFTKWWEHYCNKKNSSSKSNDMENWFSSFPSQTETLFWFRSNSCQHRYFFHFQIYEVIKKHI